ncbi:MAG: ParB/RepB/Spo0J family partition protein [Pseudomonadota bacterium]
MADVVEEGGDASKSSIDKLVPIENIVPNADQPRKRFASKDLDDLAASIREKGVIQPLIVRARDHDTYEIVAGERRWRAAQLAQLHQLPVIVREFTDIEVLEVAIIENIQRADLNPVEEAAGYRQLMDKFGHTQEKLAAALGKSRSHIANLLRLLHLPEAVLDMVRAGSLSAGHARALISSKDPLALARQIVNGGLSVRATEALVKKSEADAEAPKQVVPTEKDADTKALEGDLSASLGMKVIIDHKTDQERGQVVLYYKSLEELDEICRLLSKTS